MRDDESEPSEHEPRLLEVVTAYLEAVGDGLVPDRQVLLAEYSDVAPELEEFFEAQDEVAGLTAPLRDVTRVATLPLAGASDLSWLEEEEASVASDPRLAAVLEARGYELLGEGARGGAGIVYKARQRRLNRLVAVKTIGVGRQVSPIDLQRFRNEAETLGGLSHPNIVPVYEVAEHDSRLFLFMPYLEGGSLADGLDSCRDEPRAAVGLVEKVARAVHHAHRHGFLHRDLKPSNILLDGSGEPQVSDFGLATRLDGESDLTLTGAIVGTPSFMAPEQAERHRGAPTTSTDVYGIGAVLYALLTGRPPFRGETPLNTLEMVRSTPPTRPRTLNPRVDRDLETICLKCLENEPKARYGSAEALAEDLERWLGGEPIAARPVGPVLRGWRWARRNRAVAGLLGLVGALLIAGFAGLLVSNAAISRKNTEIIRQRNRAKQLVEDMYTQVAERVLPNLPGMEQVRRDLLTKALTYYEEESAQGNGSSAAAREDRARAYARVGKIHVLLGELRPAEQAHRKALALFEGLIADFPQARAHRYGRLDSMINLAVALSGFGDPESIKKAEALCSEGIELCQKLTDEFPDDQEFRHLLGRLYFGRGGLMAADGRLENAEHSYSQTIRLMGQLIAQSPGVAEYRQLIARSQRQRGVISYKRGMKRDAERDYRESLSTYEKLMATDPASSEYRGEMAANLHFLALIFHESQRVSEAEVAYNRALDLNRKLAEDFPSVPIHRRNLAADFAMLAHLLAEMKRPKDAEAAFKSASETSEKLVNEFPQSVGYGVDQASVFDNFAEFLIESGRLPEAETCFGRMIAHLDSLDAKHPGQPEVQSLWGAADHSLGELLQRQGKNRQARAALIQALIHQKEAVKLGHGHPWYFGRLIHAATTLAEVFFSLNEDDKALETIADVTRLAPDDASGNFHRGVFLADWAGRMATDSKLRLTDARRAELKHSYAERAVESLQQAVKKGFNDVESFKRQHVFDSIKDRDNFKQIVKELDANSRAK